MGYFAKNNEGEVCVHSAGLIDGYFEDEEATKNAFVEVNGKR